MGVFEKSFKRELGKNAAKRVSNALFGNKWSTPYKRINSDNTPSASAQARLAHEETQREKIELRRRQIELEERRHREELEIRNKQISAESDKYSVHRAEAQKIRTSHIWELDSAVIKNVDTVIAIEIPADESGIETLALKLCNQLSTEQWSPVGSNGVKSPEGAIRDKYVNALLTKYLICIKQLIDKFPDNPSIPYLQEQKFRNEQKQRNAQVWPISKNDELVNAIEVPCDESSIVKIIEELQLHYKTPRNISIRNKYLEALSVLEKVNPDNSIVSTAYLYDRKKIWSERWNNHRRTWLYIGGALLVIYIIGLLHQMLGVPQQQRLGLIVTSIIYILLAIIVVIPLIGWFIRKQRLSSYRKTKTNGD